MAKLVEYVISLKDKFTNPIQNAKKGVDELESKLKKLDDNTSKASKGGGGMGAMFGGAAALAAGAALAVGAAGIAVLNMGSNMEQTRVRFETFTGSVEAGNAMIAKLQNFALKTPFDDEQVLKAGQSMLAFGVAQDEVEGKLKTLGNISAATGKDFNELATIYGKNKLAGIIQAEDLNQLTEAGIPVYDSLAKQMGVTTDQVKKMGSEGKISFAMLEKSFEELGGDGGKWGDLMEKQSATFGGRLSSLQGVAQNLGGTLGEAMLPFMGTLVDAGNTLGQFISNNKEAFGKMFEPFFVALQPLWDAFATIGEQLGITSDSGSFLETVFNGIGTVIKFLAPLIEGLATTIGFVATKTFEVVKAFADWYSRTEWIQKGVQFIYVAFTSVFSEIVTKATQTFGGLADIIGGVFNMDLDQISKGISGLGEGMSGGVGNIYDKIKEGMSQPFEGVDLFGDTGTGLAEEIKKKTEGGSGNGTGNGNGNGNNNPKLTDAIGSATGSKSNTYNISINKLIETYTNHFTNVKEAKEDIERMVLQALTSGVSDLTNNLR